jgi:hypothetical protein
VIELKEGNIGTIGEGPGMVTYHYRGMTGEEQARYINDAIRVHGTSEAVSYIDVAKGHVTAIENLFENDGVTPIKTILEYLATTNLDGAGYGIMAMGVEIWNRTNGINKKKSSPPITPEPSDTSPIDPNPSSPPSSG